MKSAWRVGLKAVIVLGLTVFTVAELWLGAASRSKAVVLALREQEVRELAAHSGYPLQDFWDRARAIGVKAVVLSPQSARSLWERGDILHFKDSKALEWPWVNSASANMAKGNTLWTHSRALLQRLQTSASSQKLAVATASIGGLFALRLPEGLDVRNLSAGFDPDAYAWAQSSGLILALEPDESNSWIPPPALAGRTIYIADPALENFSSILQMAKDRGAHAAWPDSSLVLDLDTVGINDERALLAEYLTSESIPGRLWRAVWGRGARLLIVPMPVENGLEPNLSRLRHIAGQLRNADFVFDFSKAGADMSSWGMAAKIRCALAFLLAGLGPLLAVRQGLAALRCVSCKTRWPQAYPVPELALGILRTVGVAAGVGLACYALLSLPSWNLGLLRVYWGFCSFGIPLAFSVLALYAEDVKNWRKLLDRSLNYREVLQGMAWLAVLWFLVYPPHSPVYALPEGLWWLPLRWKEAFVGVPCLVVAFYIHLHRLESKQPKAASSKSSHKSHVDDLDPRHWLLFGLLAPIGTVYAFGLGLMPPEMILIQTIQVFAIGTALGGMAVAWYFQQNW